MDRSEEMFYFFKSKMPHLSDEEIMAMVNDYNKGTYSPKKSSPPMEEAAKPDFIDLDGDGDKEESMKKAAADKKAGKKGKKGDDKEEQNESFRAQIRKQLEEILKIK